MKRLSIKKLKIIRDLSLDLEKVNVLVGANNSGKSSVLQAIHFAVSLSQAATFIEIPLDFGKGKQKCKVEISPKQLLYTPLHEIVKLGYNDILSKEKNGSIEIELLLENNEEGKITISKSKNENISIEFVGRNVILILSDIQHPFSIYVPGLAGIAKAESYLAQGILLRAVARGDANLVLRNVLYHLNREEKKWKSFLSSIRRVFPDTEIQLSFKPEIDEFIDVHTIQSGTSLPLELAGTGFLQTVQILTYIYLFEPEVVLLDEPDAHLHPNNQKALAKLLAELTVDKSIQIITATHSRHILDTLRDEAKKIWLYEGKLQSNTEHLDILMELGALDSLEGLLARGIKYVLLTEDTDKKPLNTVLSSLLTEDEYMIWSYHSCTKFDSAQTVAAFIRDVSPTSVIIIHRDSDYFLEGDIDYLRNKYESLSIKTFFTEGVDIEAYFCKVEHLISLNCDFQDEVRAAIIKASQECQEDFKKKAMNGRQSIENFLYKEGLSTLGRQGCIDWSEKLDYSEFRWLHGKTFLKAIRGNFQNLTSKNLNVFEPTEYIIDDSLKHLLGKQNVLNLP